MNASEIEKEAKFHEQGLQIITLLLANGYTVKCNDDSGSKIYKPKSNPNDVYAKNVRNYSANNKKAGRSISLSAYNWGGQYLNTWSLSNSERNPVSGGYHKQWGYYDDIVKYVESLVTRADVPMAPKSERYSFKPRWYGSRTTFIDYTGKACLSAVLRTVKALKFVNLTPKGKVNDQTEDPNSDPWLLLLCEDLDRNNHKILYRDEGWLPLNNTGTFIRNNAAGSIELSEIDRELIVRAVKHFLSEL